MPELNENRKRHNEKLEQENNINKARCKEQQQRALDIQRSHTQKYSKLQKINACIAVNNAVVKTQDENIKDKELQKAKKSEQVFKYKALERDQERDID